MTQQTFEKARELQSRINALESIDMKSFIRPNQCVIDPICNEDYEDIKTVVEKTIQNKLANYKKQFQKL